MSSRSTAISASLLTAVLALPAQGQSPPSEYVLKERAPATGSNIRRQLVGPMRFPVNKPYAEFTDAEKQAVKDLYEPMAPGDEPPFPLESMRPILDALAQAQQKLLVKGELFLIAKVTADGSVEEVKTVGAPSAAMNRFAGQLLLLTKFKPAACAGQPCTMEFPLYLNFSVR